jgi:crotonobetainyl-CoA:carnitine CoA-transferase CaiB-like acyl-CoA transferase
MTNVGAPEAAAQGGGALSGVKVVELASEFAGFAGKILGDLGADVIVVEPPGGHATRSYGPFLDDEPGAERSLWWWYYNTSKRSVVLDLDTAHGAEQFARLASEADIVLEGERPQRLGRLHLDHTDLRPRHPSLIWVSVTPFGRHGSRADESATDLTLLAGGGPVWNCGYDDHELPPVRGGGNQAYHTAGVFAVLAALTALVHRDAGGNGQHVDVSMHAAANVTTESGTFVWLVAHETIQRQTGRHAATVQTLPVQCLAGDGRYVTTGFLPHEGRHLQAIIDWMNEIDIIDEFPDAVFLQMGVDRGGIDRQAMADDPEAALILGATRDALIFIASRLNAYDFFVGAQARDMQCGIVYAPEETFEDPHFLAREFPVEVFHEDLDRSVAYPGAPFKMSGSPWAIHRRPPHVGEHSDEILGPP